MKYKVGDKVKIKSLNWYENSEKDDYGIRCEKNYFIPKMAKFCGREAVIKSVFNTCYKIDTDGCYFNWDDEMLEQPKKKRKHKNKKYMDSCKKKDLLIGWTYEGIPIPDDKDIKKIKEIKVLICKNPDGTFWGQTTEDINGDTQLNSCGKTVLDCMQDMICAYEELYKMNLKEGKETDKVRFKFEVEKPKEEMETKNPNSDAEIFKSITDKMLETFIKKNHDYGGSFEKGCDEDGLVSARTRLRDKWERFKKLSSGELAQVKDESIRDTLLDLSNYCILTVMWLDKQEKKKNLEDKK